MAEERQRFEEERMELEKKEQEEREKKYREREKQIEEHRQALCRTLQKTFARSPARAFSFTENAVLCSFHRKKIQEEEEAKERSRPQPLIVRVCTLRVTACPLDEKINK